LNSLNILTEGTIQRGGDVMDESTYKVIEVVGTSKNSFEEAISNAVSGAGKTLKDLRIADVVKLDVTIRENKVALFRARVNISFKVLGDGDEDFIW
jgi:flavin-binding protein dodecin